MSCAGLITLNYKLAVARSLAEDMLPRVGDFEPAKLHLQRALNALTAPGKHANDEERKAAEHAGYHEIEGVLGNPVHGMKDKDIADTEGMGIISHIKRLGKRPNLELAVNILGLARKYAADEITRADDAASIQRCGRVVASMLRAAQEAIASSEFTGGA